MGFKKQQMYNKKPEIVISGEKMCFI